LTIVQWTYVVDVLARDGGASGAGLLAFDTGGGVLELGTLLCQAALVLLGVIVLVRLVLDWDNVVVVSLGKNLLIGNGLDGGVVVVLVDLLVHGSSHVLMLLLGDGLVLDGLQMLSAEYLNQSEMQ
jgi:hypothetical protein